MQETRFFSIKHLIPRTMSESVQLVKLLETVVWNRIGASHPDLPSLSIYVNRNYLQLTEDLLPLDTERSNELMILTHYVRAAIDDLYDSTINYSIIKGCKEVNFVIGLLNKQTVYVTSEYY